MSNRPTRITSFYRINNKHSVNVVSLQQVKLLNHSFCCVFLDHTVITVTKAVERLYMNGVGHKKLYYLGYI